MKDTITVEFVIPKDIQKGLKSGVLERVGGVIREKKSKNIVLWLKEGSKIKNGQKIVLYLPNFAKATLAFSDFLYMHNNFKAIKESLDEINKKIDAKILAKIQTGLELAAEAEKMADKKVANAQIINARQYLIEGSAIYKNLYKNLFKEKKSYEYLKSIALLQTSILSDLNERETSNIKNWFSPPPLTITWML